MRFDMPDVKANLRHIVCDFTPLRQILTFGPSDFTFLHLTYFTPVAPLASPT